jgi:hypothetical protein
MHFRVKNTLKNNRNHTSKHTLKKNYTRNLDLFGINPNKFDIMIIFVIFRVNFYLEMMKIIFFLF